MTKPFALLGSTIYALPDEPPIVDGVVLIAGATIAAVGSSDTVRVPSEARVLDCAGSSITAGLWNSHVHFFERKWAEAGAIPATELSAQLREMSARYGFTSVFDLGSQWENTRRIRERIESGEVPGPRIRSTGEGLIPPGGMPPDLILHMMGCMKVPLPEVVDALQAAAAAKNLLERGVDGIKLFASTPRSESLSEEVIRAAADEAHRAGKPVFVHPNNPADVLRAVRGGADVIAHTIPSSGPWDASLLAEMKERDVALTPTLMIWKTYARHDRMSAQQQVVNTTVSQLRDWLALDGTVLFGTDLGAVDYDPTEEYLLMSAAGMSFAQILASLTTTPAERFGESHRLGRIAAGFEADLAVFQGDPLGPVRYTIRSGTVTYG